MSECTNLPKVCFYFNDAIRRSQRKWKRKRQLQITFSTCSYPTILFSLRLTTVNTSHRPARVQHHVVGEVVCRRGGVCARVRGVGGGRVAAHRLHRHAHRTHRTHLAVRRRSTRLPDLRGSVLPDEQKGVPEGGVGLCGG